MDEAPPLCPDCGQPASADLAGPPHGWECRNEACPEFGQPLRPDEGVRLGGRTSGGASPQSHDPT